MVWSSVLRVSGKHTGIAFPAFPCDFEIAFISVFVGGVRTITFGHLGNKMSLPVYTAVSMVFF